MSNGLLFLGFGYVARHFAGRVGSRPLAAVIRSPEQRAVLEAKGIRALAWNEGRIDPAAFAGAGAVLISTPPDEAGCPALQSAGELIAQAGMRWVGYLSATSVYGDAGGDWVDEETPPRPDTGRGQARLAAEETWRAHAAAHGYPLIIFRIAGIYGPGRSAVDQLRTGTAKRIDKPGHVANRIHVEDIATALAASLADPAAGALFNLGDDLPAPSHEVVAHAATLLGMEPPPLVPYPEAALSPMALSFYTDNKRVANRRMKEALGVTLAFPTYREGLARLAAEDAGAGQDASPRS